MNNGKINGITFGIILIIVTLVICCLVITTTNDTDIYAPFTVILSLGSLIATILIGDTAKKYLWKDEFHKEWEDDLNNRFGSTDEEINEKN